MIYLLCFLLPTISATEECYTLSNIDCAAPYFNSLVNQLEGCGPAESCSATDGEMLLEDLDCWVHIFVTCPNFPVPAVKDVTIPPQPTSDLAIIPLELQWTLVGVGGLFTLSFIGCILWKILPTLITVCYSPLCCSTACCSPPSCSPCCPSQRLGRPSCDASIPPLGEQCDHQRESGTIVTTATAETMLSISD